MGAGWAMGPRAEDWTGGRRDEPMSTSTQRTRRPPPLKVRTAILKSFRRARVTILDLNPFWLRRNGWTRWWRIGLKIDPTDSSLETRLTEYGGPEPIQSITHTHTQLLSLSFSDALASSSEAGVGNVLFFLTYWWAWNTFEMILLQSWKKWPWLEKLSFRAFNFSFPPGPMQLGIVVLRFVSLRTLSPPLLYSTLLLWLDVFVRASQTEPRQQERAGLFEFPSIDECVLFPLFLVFRFFFFF